jgi:hypothetical protein
MTPSHREFDPDHIPLAFMITLRAHGTWLHGDSRGSVDSVSRSLWNAATHAQSVATKI